MIGDTFRKAMLTLSHYRFVRRELLAMQVAG